MQQQQQPAFGGFMNDATAQMGFQVGKNAVMAGQEYVEQNVSTGDPRYSRLELTLRSMLDQSLYQCPRYQALLQCIQLLCGYQVVLSALPLEA